MGFFQLDFQKSSTDEQGVWILYADAAKGLLLVVHTMYSLVAAADA